MRESFQVNKTAASLFDRLIAKVSLWFMARRANHLRTLRGRPFAVFADDWIGANVYIHGIYEQANIDLTISVLQQLKIKLQDASAIDVGANIGNHSVQYSRYFDSVYAYEPNPRAYDLLRHNTYDLDNVSIENVAIGNEQGILELFENSSNYGNTSSSPESQNGSAISVSIDTLDNLIPKDLNVALVKIDVEGMEHSVLLGALDLLAQAAPVVCFEQHPAEFDTSPQETESIKLLRSLGYEIFAPKPDQGVSKLVSRIWKALGLFLGKNERVKITRVSAVDKAHYSMLMAIPKSRLLIEMD